MFSYSSFGSEMQPGVGLDSKKCLLEIATDGQAANEKWLASHSLNESAVRLRQATAHSLKSSLPLRWERRLERVTRLELATSSLARRCSTTELHPRLKG